MGETSPLFQLLTFSAYADGSTACSPHDPPLVPAASANEYGVLTKDLTFNSDNATWLRLFLPNTTQEKLPFLLYFHGGGFLAGSTAIPTDHNFLCCLASQANTLILSVEYRLAPEHRLPCAYDDCMEALLWLRQMQGQLVKEESSVDPWLRDHADFSRVFLGGDSAGANIVHHVAVKAAASAGFAELGGGVCLRGYILIHPFFASETPTESEALQSNVFEFVRKIWHYGLPEGSNMDHPYANPMASPSFQRDIAALPPAIILVAGADFLRDKGIVYFLALQKAGKETKLFVSEDEPHVFHLLNPSSRNFPVFVDAIASFINS